MSYKNFLKVIKPYLNHCGLYINTSKKCTSPERRDNWSNLNDFCAVLNFLYTRLVNDNTCAY